MKRFYYRQQTKYIWTTSIRFYASVVLSQLRVNVQFVTVKPRPWTRVITREIAQQYNIERLRNVVSFNTYPPRKPLLCHRLAKLYSIRRAGQISLVEYPLLDCCYWVYLSWDRWSCYHGLHQWRHLEAWNHPLVHRGNISALVLKNVINSVAF